MIGMENQVTVQMHAGTSLIWPVEDSGQWKCSALVGIPKYLIKQIWSSEKEKDGIIVLLLVLNKQTFHCGETSDHEKGFPQILFQKGKNKYN